MRPIYLETSSLLLVLLRQPGFEPVARLLEDPEVQPVTSAITLIETRRAITRLCGEGVLKEGDARVLRGTLAEQERQWQVLEVIPSIQARAGDRFPVEPVRTLDAIHLATALEFQMAHPTLEICSHDARIAENLEPLGLVRCEA